MSCLAAFAGSLLLAGCRDAGLALGGSNAGAKARAEEVFIGFASRYLNVHHGAKYDYARTRLADAALVPSRAFDDTAVWTASPAPTLRVLRIGEHTTPAGVHEEDAAVDVPWPYRMGDAVHTVALSRLPGKGEYAWDTDVNFALGAVHADDVGDAVAAVFAAAEGRSEPQLRADYRGAFPHSADVLGQLFSIDTIHPSHLPDGSTLLTLWIGLHPEGLTAHYPVFWEYMAKYVRSTRYQLSLSDPAGAEYFTIGTTGQLMTVRVRTLKGRMVPLAGGTQPLPDTLVLSGTFTTKIKIFTLGTKKFTSEFVIGRDAHERTWTLHFRKEPEWQLPMAAARLMRSPLRRPFEGNGVWFRVGVRDSSGAQTIFTRRLHAEVKESAIMHWLGGLISKVAGDLGGKTEQEEFAFLGSVFEALAEDVGGLYGGAPGKKPEEGGR